MCKYIHRVVTPALTRFPVSHSCFTLLRWKDYIHHCPVSRLIGPDEANGGDPCRRSVIEIIPTIAVAAEAAAIYRSCYAAALTRSVSVSALTLCHKTEISFCRPCRKAVLYNNVRSAFWSCRFMTSCSNIDCLDLQ